MSNRSPLRPFLELTGAAVLWGFGFVATRWSLEGLGPAAITTYRFLIAFAVCAATLPLLKISRTTIKNEFRISMLAGVSLGLCLFLQTWGLQYTTATNSSFITTLYVVIVPILARLFLKEHLHLLHWLWVGLALVGTAMIVQLHTLSLNKGDLLVFACSILASIQIVYVSAVASRSGNAFVFNTFQSLWAGMPFLILIGQGGSWSLANLTWKGWLGLSSLTFGSTVLGFYLQVRAQKEINPNLASLMFLMESPFGCLFAVLLLKESLSLQQAMGGVLILAACILAILIKPKPT